MTLPHHPLVTELSGEQHSFHCCGIMIPALGSFLKPRRKTPLQAVMPQRQHALWVCFPVLQKERFISWHRPFIGRFSVSTVPVEALLSMLLLERFSPDNRTLASIFYLYNPYRKAQCTNSASKHPTCCERVLC